MIQDKINQTLFLAALLTPEKKMPEIINNNTPASQAREEAMKMLADKQNEIRSVRGLTYGNSRH